MNGLAGLFARSRDGTTALPLQSSKLSVVATASFLGTPAAKVTLAKAIFTPSH
jgi:hypothetical protein